MNNIPDPTWLEINLSAIEHNTHTILDRVKVPVMAVVKDNAYGHGAVEVSKTFLAAGGSRLGVVRLQEGLELRGAGVEAPILNLGGVTLSEIDTAIGNKITLPVYSFEQAEVLSRRAHELGMTIPIHLKLDTGMGRFGVFADQALALAQHVLKLGRMEIEGLYSQMPVARDDTEFTRRQIQQFTGALSALHEAGIHPPLVHLANSEGVLCTPDSWFSMVRSGSAIYGLLSEADQAEFSLPIRTAMEWKARFMSCKAYPEDWGIGYGQDYRTKTGEVLGVLAVGHGDGFRRVAGNEVLVDGKRAPVAGIVCMDHVMVSLSKEVPLDAEAVILGRQGDENISIFELSKRWNTPWTNLVLVNPRVPRYYVKD